jgi:competence protein ComEC
MRVLALLSLSACVTKPNPLSSQPPSTGTITCNKMLITGDAEDEKSKTVRNALTERLRTEHLYPIDVFVVGHHGSKTSNSDELLFIIKPTYAVISSEGPDKKYHNPNRDIMERLVSTQAKIFATCKSGDITVAFKDEEILLSPPDSELLILENYEDVA